MYDQYTRGMATTRHMSLVETGGRKAFVRDKDLAQKKGGGGEMSGKMDIHEFKQKDSST